MSVAEHAISSLLNSGKAAAVPTTGPQGRHKDYVGRSEGNVLRALIRDFCDQKVRSEGPVFKKSTNHNTEEYLSHLLKIMQRILRPDLLVPWKDMISVGSW
ncbi:hypothetical protein E4U10_002765 [Claviceps purpurea]|nr:hypothetical protein E4U10_002765 [Claviceps purpurea]